MTINAKQNLLSLAAALLLSITSIGAAVGPAHAVETAPTTLVA